MNRNFSFSSLFASVGIAIVGAHIITMPANAQSQKIGSAYISWEWGTSPQGSSTYLVICSDPDYNTNPDRGGDCNDIDVFNEKVNDLRNRSIRDRLVVGTRYRICITADNHPRIGKDRWNSCNVITMQSKYQIRYDKSSMNYVGKP